MSKIRTPLCKYCHKDCKRVNSIYCSKECYTASGHRAAMGRKSGGLAHKDYWEKYAAAFKRRFGNLPFPEQVKMLIKLGQRRAYRPRKVTVEDPHHPTSG